MNKRWVGCIMSNNMYNRLLLHTYTYTVGRNWKNMHNMA
jgi:hypothetical protein